jgi:hypothetical protein
MYNSSYKYKNMDIIANMIVTSSWLNFCNGTQALGLDPSGLNTLILDVCTHLTTRML